MLDNAILIAVLIGFGVLQFGWVVFPALGTVTALLNLLVFGGIIVSALAWRLLKHKSDKSGNDAAQRRQ